MDVGAKLRAVQRFVDAAAIVCDASRELGVREPSIVLRFDSGEIAVAIGNAGAITADRAGSSVPLLGPAGSFGALTYGVQEPIPPQLERELALLATQLSVWCTAHGISTIPRDLLGKLGPRQYRIAQLAARGLHNAEIAGELGISINTVKARLKEVFERLAIHDRAELAPIMARLAPLDDIVL